MINSFENLFTLFCIAGLSKLCMGGRSPWSEREKGIGRENTFNFRGGEVKTPFQFSLYLFGKAAKYMLAPLEDRDETSVAEGSAPSIP